MAKNTKGSEQAKTAQEPDLDISNFLPEGFSADVELVNTGGLPPTFKPSTCGEGPIVGRLLTYQQMPETKDKRAWTAYLIELTGPCKAETPDGEKIQTYEAGDVITLPANGSLENNRDLQKAALDPDNVWIAIIRNRGQKDVGKASPMWDYDVKLHPKTTARTGKYAFYNQQAPAVESRGAAAPRLANGAAA